MTPREHATLAVETATAALDDARKWLREEVKAEIAALSIVSVDAGFSSMTTAVEFVLGPSETIDDDDGPFVMWCLSSKTWIALALRHDGFRVEACCPSENRRGEWRLSDMTLDAAVKAALLWLADRDVFVEVRR